MADITYGEELPEGYFLDGSSVRLTPIPYIQTEHQSAAHYDTPH